MKPTIAITLYRRPEQTKILFEALEGAYGFEDFKIFIHVDVSMEHVDACHDVCALANNFGMKHSNVRQVYHSDPRLGVDKAKLFILPKAFQNHDRVIFLEDDTVLSKDALLYFEWALKQTENDHDCLSISGYNRREDPCPVGDEFTVSMRPGFCPWGWATHKRVWDKFYDEGRYERYSGENVNGLFDHYLDTEGKERAMYSVYPILGRTNHGTWQDAEHTPSEEHWLEHENSEYGIWLPVYDLTVPLAMNSRYGYKVDVKLDEQLNLNSSADF